jgi:hypothetical protein
MVFLPILFWCGYEQLGRAAINLLAFGVIVSGIIKDLLCLPRPVSPPLQRITMSGSAALEYGFPSTHTTNAVSVAVYVTWLLSAENSSISSEVKMMWTVLSYIYALSISFGRIYCGMHGFTDVVTGGALGTLLTLCEIEFGKSQYDWVVNGTIMQPLIVTLVMLVLVRTHPEPADNCPCFDDSVAFAGVVIGANFAMWHNAQTHSPFRNFLGITADPRSIVAGVPFLSHKNLIRIPLGVAIIVGFRSVTKPLLLLALPPLFRIFEQLDLDLPRRYFLKASQYNTVPRLHRDDNVLPNPSDVGQMIGDVRRRRGRAISVGPQSVADAYEVIAYRSEARRRERSISASRGKGMGGSRNSDRFDRVAEEMMKETAEEAAENDADMKERQTIFSTLPRIRIRYDVEVVTKLIVYSGIGWLALEGCQLVFEILGLGVA